ncbi:MAG: hypothetical protein OHK0024_34490 [Thalassobaculales bacterium]
MNATMKLAAAVGATLLMAGCSFVSESVMPSLTGEAPSTQAIAPSAGERAGQPLALGNTNFQLSPPAAGQPTGTFVGQKVAQLRDDLRRLQDSIRQNNDQLQRARAQTVQNAQSYHTQVGAINARLQVGTTPGNPILVQQWNDAQRQLDTLTNDIATMNGLSNRVAGDAAMSAYLLEAVRAAYGLAGGIDEDHRQLAVLEDETNRTVVLIDRLLNELSDDVARQTAYMNNERSNLTTLSLAIKNGQLYGQSLASRAFQGGSLASLSQGGASSGPAVSGARRPLVVIRFDRQNPAYEQALYTAVSRALERRPDAAFDLVAVTPQRAGAGQSALNATNARRNAESVLRTLTGMGLPPGRVNLSATSSGEAQSNEVHLYLR